MPFAHEDIDCPHRIGMEYTEKNPGTKVKSIILDLNFTSQGECENDSKMLDQNISKIIQRNEVTNQFLSVDLTKRLI